MEPIKVEDEYALELAKKLVGYRRVLDDLALQRGATGMEFWKRLQKVYNLDKEKSYLFDHVNNEIREG